MFLFKVLILTIKCIKIKYKRNRNIKNLKMHQRVYQLI